MPVKIPRKFRLFIYIVLTIISFEVGLQLVSFALYLKRSHQALPQKGDFTIMCLVTYGIGAPPEHSYPNQLEKLLNSQNTQRHFRVINLGVPGNNSSLCLKMLKEKFDIYRPEVVTLLVGFNNQWNFMESNFSKVKQLRYNNPLESKLRILDGILLKSKVYKLCKIAYVNVSTRVEPVQALFSPNRLPAREFRMPRRSEELQKLLYEGEENFEAGHYEESEAEFRKAMEMSPDDYEPHWYMAKFYEYRGDKKQALGEAIFAATHAPHPYTVSCIFADIKHGVGGEELASVIKRLRENLVEKFGEEYVRMLIDPMIESEKSDLEKLLVYDFDEMGKFTRQKMAKMVVVTYPFSASHFGFPDDIYYRIGHYLDVPVLDNVRFFNSYLKKFSKEELFSTDGHLTKLGYSFVAKNLFELLKQRRYL